MKSGRRNLRLSAGAKSAAGKWIRLATVSRSRGGGGKQRQKDSGEETHQAKQNAQVKEGGSGNGFLFHRRKFAAPRSAQSSRHHKACPHYFLLFTIHSSDQRRVRRSFTRRLVGEGGSPMTRILGRQPPNKSLVPGPRRWRAARRTARPWTRARRRRYTRRCCWRGCRAGREFNGEHRRASALSSVEPFRRCVFRLVP